MHVVIYNFFSVIQPAHEKIGVVDAQWIVHMVLPSLGDQVFHDIHSLVQLNFMARADLLTACSMSCFSCLCYGISRFV